MTSREAFEKWWRKKYRQPASFVDEIQSYNDEYVQAAWEGWMAGRSYQLDSPYVSTYKRTQVDA